MSIKPIKGRPYKIYEGGVENTSSEGKGKIGHRLPEFELLSTDLPEIKDWKIGGKIVVTLEVTPISINNTDKNEVINDGPFGNDDEKKDKEEVVIARVEITGVKVDGSEEPKPEEKKKKDVFGEMKGGVNKIG